MAAPQNSRHRLKLGSKLGSGAFGLVYKGTYDGGDVAVKTLAENNVGNKDAERMFFREARVLQRIHHPNIMGFKALCKLPRSGENSPQRWALVLELLKDGSLYQKVIQQVTSPQRKVYTDLIAARWALDVARGLEHLHFSSPTVIHRDIKLANIMLKQEGGRLMAKISDFGLHVTTDTGKQGCMLRVSMDVARSTSAPPFVSLPSPPIAGTLNPIASGIPDVDEDGVAILGENPAAEAAQVAANQQQQREGSRDAGEAAVVSPGADLRPHTHQAPKQGLIHSVASKEGSGPEAPDDYYAEFHTTSVGKPHIYKSSDNSLALQRATSFSSPDLGASHTSCCLEEQGPSLPGLRRQRSASRKRAAHHTSGFTCQAAGGSFTALRRPGFAAEEEDWEHGSIGGSSICTMASLSEDCSLSSCTDEEGLADLEGVVGDLDVETVFMLTGATGSCMYMAPEVHLKQPYNEKADVFSFGVVLFELFARTMLLFTELPVAQCDPEGPNKYAQKVAEGYRPARPRKFPEEVWRLVTWCWSSDPVARPHMSEVVEAMEALVGQLEVAKGAKAGRGAVAPATDSLYGKEPPDAGSPAVACGAPPAPGCACTIS